VRAAAWDPLAELPADPVVAALPKADLHVHAEADGRLDRVLAAREGVAPRDWAPFARRLMELPPGMARLRALGQGEQRCRPVEEVDLLDARPELFVARVADLLQEAAADGALLVEPMFGGATILYPDFVALFREAERSVQARHQGFRAEPLIALYPHRGPDELLGACVRAARDGLAGVHLLAIPYDEEADPAPMRAWAARAAEAGLAVAAHAGEFTTANLASTLRLPGLRRVGHAVHAADDPRLLDALAASGATVECCPTCNVVLGAVRSYEEHPIRRLVERGVPVTLATDNPLRCRTTIGREYAVAAALGFSAEELRGFTRNAVRASFTTDARRGELQAELGWPS
jgi:hypothetical protein